MQLLVSTYTTRNGAMVISENMYFNIYFINIFFYIGRSQIVYQQRDSTIDGDRDGSDSILPFVFSVPQFQPNISTSNAHITNSAFTLSIYEALIQSTQYVCYYCGCFIFSLPLLII